MVDRRRNGADASPAHIGAAAGPPECAEGFGKVHHGDNLELLRRLPDACCDLVYVDPPFFTQKRRVGSPEGGPVFADRFEGGRDQYLAFLRPRLGEIRRTLSGRGTVYVHLDWRIVHYVKVLLDELFGEENFLNEIIWSYRTGGRPGRHFARKHDTILMYARRAGDHTFHPQRGGRYRTEGLRFDSGGRPFKTTRNGRLYFNEKGPRVTDVWELPFLSTVSSERVGYPTQKPLALLERIVRTSTDAGDRVADFFCGSGTTLVAAVRLGRRFVGCDRSAAAVEISRARVEAAVKDLGRAGP